MRTDVLVTIDDVRHAIASVDDPEYPGLSIMDLGLLDAISSMEGARLPGQRRREAIARAKAEGLDVPAVFIRQARDLAGSA